MARDIATDDEAMEVARWMQANKSDPDYGTVRAKLAAYVDAQPRTTEEEAASRRTAFGDRVMGQQQESPAPTAAPVPAPPDRSGELPSLTPNTGARSVPHRGLNERATRTIGAPISAGLEGLKAVGDLALSGAISGFGMAVGGLAGLSQYMAPIGSATPAEAVNYWSDKISRMPQSQGGRALAEGLSVPIIKYDETAKDIAGALAFGNPEAATTLYTILNAPIQIAGGRVLPVRIAQSLKTWQLKLNYLRRGIRIGSSEMDEQLIKAVRRENQDVPTQRGVALNDTVIPSVRRVHADDTAAIARTEGNLAASPAQVNIEGAEATRTRLQQMLEKSFPKSTIEGTPVTEALAELDRLVGIERGSRGTELRTTVAMGQPTTLHLRRTQEAWRPYQELAEASERIGAKLPKNPKSLSPQAAALQMVKSAYDDLLDSRIRQGFVNGDEALEGNRALLTKLRAQYQERFAPDTEILRMATDLKASPEDFRKMLFGLSESGMKTEAAQFLGQLKKIFGEESPQLNAMRLEFLSDALAPLQGSNPSIPNFIKHYENIRRKNKTTIDALDPYAGRMLEEIYDAARASQRVGTPSRFTLNPLKFIPRYVIGHQISRKGATVNAVQQLAEALFGRTEKTVRRQMLNEIAGIDTKAPMFKHGTTTMQAAYAAAVSNEFGEEE